MQQSFESSGIVKKQKVIPNIRLIIGTSFKVLPLERFYLARGINFLVDPHPQINGCTEFQQIWDEAASTGTAKALISIKNLYQQY